MPARSVVSQRLAAVPNSADKSVELTDEVGLEIIRRLQSKYDPRRIPTRQLRGKGQRLDARDIDRDLVIEWLKGLPIDLEERILAVWPAYRKVVEMPYGLFAENYDDFWYPSSDDVWLTNQQMSWWIAIDHEEFLIYEEA